MLKVLIITPWFPSELHPIEGIFVKEQALALAEQFQIAVFVPQASSVPMTGQSLDDAGQVTLFRQHEPGSRDKGCSSYEWKRRMYRSASALLHRTPLNSVLHQRTFQQYQRGFENGLEQVLAKFGIPDLIHTHVTYPTGAALAVSELSTRIPVVITEHASNFPLLHLDSRFKQRASGSAIHHANHVIAVSNSLADTIRLHCNPNAISVVGNIVDTDFFTLPATHVPNTEYTFLAVGSLSRKKGLHILLKAARELKEQSSSNFRIRIAGDGPEKTQLKAQIAACKLDGHVTLLGRLSREDVRNEMQRCDCFAMPSLNESFGIVFAEAMACGKPVIATRCGGPENFVTPETGILLPAGDFAPLVKAMQDMLVNNIQFDPMAIRAYAQERFSPEVVTQKIARVYKQVIAASRG